MSAELMVTGAVSGQTTDEKTTVIVTADKALGGTTQQCYSDDNEHKMEGGTLEADAWMRLPRGIALGTLLAVPFWVCFAMLAAWMLR